MVVQDVLKRSVINNQLVWKQSINQWADKITVNMEKRESNKDIFAYQLLSKSLKFFQKGPN